MKIMLSFFLMVLSFQVMLYGQSFDLNQGGFKESTYSIELPYEKVKGKIIINVTLNDKVLKFILDTGAPTAIRKGLSNDGFEVLALEEITDINGNKSTFQIVKISELVLAESLAINIPTIVFEENLLTSCFGADGIIGSNLLRNSVIQFDDNKKLIRISNNTENFDLTGSNEFNIFLDQQSSPVFKVLLGDKVSEMLLFDTGADELYSMSNTNMKKFKRTKAYIKQSESLGSTLIGINGLEEKTISHRLLIPKIIIQGLEFQNIITKTTTDGNSRLGSKLIEYGVLTVDYKNSKSYFKPYTQAPKPQEPLWNVSPTFIDGKLVVGRIWSKELNKELKVGDAIIAINKINTEEITECDYLLNNPLNSLPRASLKVKNSKGEIHDFEIERIN